MKCNLARQDVSTAAGAILFSFFFPLCHECDDIRTAHGTFCVVVVVIVSPLSFFSKKAHSLLALFSGVFSSSGSLLCSSLGISLNMACEPEESLVLAHKCSTAPCRKRDLGFEKCQSGPSDFSQASHKSALGKFRLTNIYILNLSMARQQRSHTSGQPIQWTLDYVHKLNKTDFLLGN